MKVLVVAFRLVFVGLVLLLAAPAIGESDTNAVPQTAKAEETSTQEMMRAYLQLQEQIHATQLAVEQTRKEAQETSVKSSEALANRLNAIESALSVQRARELEAFQSSNRVMVFMAGTFAVIGFIAMLIMAYFQSRTVHGLAEISAVIPPLRALGPGPALTALPPAEAAIPSSPAVEKSSNKLVGALEQLEKRIVDLEHATAPIHELTPAAGPAGTSGSNGNGHKNGSAHQESSDNGEPDNGAGATPEVKGLLSEGQKLLDADQADAALNVFERVLQINPRHAETLVKKGIALEKLRKLQEAIDCFDAAISADSSMTIAYLHKGGVFHRMERYNEALECYEKALRTQEKRGI